MARIVILGAGVMGTAFGVPLADRGHEVHYVGTHLDGDWIAAMRREGRHPKLGAAVPETAAAHPDEALETVLADGADLVVLGVSSAGIDWAIGRLADALPHPVPICLLTKGLASDGERLRILPPVVAEGLAAAGLGPLPIAAVGGPCIAGELAVRRQTAVTIASEDPGFAERLVDLTAAPYYHARACDDLAGVEVCAALKNFFALGIAYPSGLHKVEPPAPNGAFRHNPAAGLFTQALAEMAYFVEHLSGRPRTAFELPGVGDLYVTCMAGRNSRMGHWLGTGLTYTEAMATEMKGETVEGADLARTIGPTLDRLLTGGHMDRNRLPLTLAIVDAICRDRPMAVPWTALWRVRPAAAPPAAPAMAGGD